MTINIQNCANVTVIGHRKSKNCKLVYNITKGCWYASVSDAAETLGVTPASISLALDRNKKRTVKGMRLCLYTDMIYHLDEISEQNRIREAKSNAYDKQARLLDEIHGARERIAKHSDRICKNNERISKYQAKIDALQAQNDKETVLLNEENAKLSKLYEEV